MKELSKGTKVEVVTRKGTIEGVISRVDVNVCTFETEYSVDYLKDGKTWTIIGVPSRAIKVIQ